MERSATKMSWNQWVGVAKARLGEIDERSDKYTKAAEPRIKDAIEALRAAEMVMHR